jgi:predicted TPR repeat methyltransferase
MKKKQISKTYNEMFSNCGADGAYELPYDISPYFPMYKRVLHYLLKYKADNVLEVGCGTGVFAKMLRDKNKISYQGFDFSPVAVNKAKALVNNLELFYC